MTAELTNDLVVEINGENIHINGQLFDSLSNSLSELNVESVSSLTFASENNDGGINVHEISLFTMISNCKDLQSITLVNSNSNGIFTAIAKHCPNLKYLNAQGGKTVLLAAINNIVESCSYLTQLNVTNIGPSDTYIYNVDTISGSKEVIFDLETISEDDLSTFFTLVTDITKLCLVQVLELPKPLIALIASGSPKLSFIANILVGDKVNGAIPLSNLLPDWKPYEEPVIRPVVEEEEVVDAAEGVVIAQQMERVKLAIDAAAASESANQQTEQEKLVVVDKPVPVRQYSQQHSWDEEVSVEVEVPQQRPPYRPARPPSPTTPPPARPVSVSIPQEAPPPKPISNSSSSGKATTPPPVPPRQSEQWSNIKEQPVVEEQRYTPPPKAKYTVEDCCFACLCCPCIMVGNCCGGASGGGKDNKQVRSSTSSTRQSEQIATTVSPMRR